MYDMRKRAGIVVINVVKENILLIHRIKREKDYWVIPGGGVEKNESFEVAAKREMLEELDIKISYMQYLFSVQINESHEVYYIAAVNESCNEIKMHGEELLRNSDDNIYMPEWVHISDLKKIRVYPMELLENIGGINFKEFHPRSLDLEDDNKLS